MQFKNGDKVKILRKARSHSKGWKDSWISPQMDKAVGKIGTVEGVNVVDHDVFLTVPGLDEEWGFPDFVLKLVSRTKRRPIKK